MRIGGPRPAASTGPAVVQQIVDSLPQPIAPPPRRAARKVTLKCRVCLKPDEPKVLRSQMHLCRSHRRPPCSWLNLLRPRCPEHVRAMLVLQKERDRTGPHALPQGADRDPPGVLSSRLATSLSTCVRRASSYVVWFPCSNATTLPQHRRAPSATTSSRDYGGGISRGRPSAARRVLT
jgi:hypothetical protein